ncbi:hypothetical protein QA600_07725 [Natronococcus sp. A-GB1]|uniref:hypothetical protein n=1 Tax=Natronococcus sp. A-GB1 TaxID=3037648 RepID=UPI00241E0AB8|nr:hypothetical protein [Natronococcus sp. A-GB1]MDG5759227.1 hypothetical protein [Natronococcus sp. A-GB1]
MFPPPFSNESILTDEMNPPTQAYHDAVVYDEADAEDPLYEGPLVVHANGWLELEGNRLLSPSAVHHVDTYDDERPPAETDDRDAVDDERRTGRFGFR